MHMHGNRPPDRERPSEAPYRGHKDDNRGHGSNGIVQKGPKDLPQDGLECTDNGFCTQDSAEGKPDYWILRGRRETPPPSTR